jgi:hypothetical protein
MEGFYFFNKMTSHKLSVKVLKGGDGIFGRNIFLE